MWLKGGSCRSISPDPLTITQMIDCQGSKLLKLFLRHLKTRFVHKWRILEGVQPWIFPKAIEKTLYKQMKDFERQYTPEISPRAFYAQMKAFSGCPSLKFPLRHLEWYFMHKWRILEENKPLKFFLRHLKRRFVNKWRVLQGNTSLDFPLR